MQEEKLNIENLFLKIFKVTVLVLMTLALVAVFVLAGAAAWEFSKRPVEPAPAQKAPEKDITLDELRRELLKQGQPQAQQPAAPASAPQVPNKLKYLEEVTRLYRCSIDFARAVGAEIEEGNSAAEAQRLEDLRQQTEKLADGSPLRGEKWVKSAVQFTCAALQDPQIIAMRKEGKVRGVFFPVLNFHIARWDQIARERQEFEQAEKARVERQKAEEAARIAVARATGLQYLIAAGAAFGVFMALALYLILARIEINLRSIARSAENLGRA